MHVPVLVAVVGASSGDGAQLLSIATEGLRGELVLQTPEERIQTSKQNTTNVINNHSNVPFFTFCKVRLVYSMSVQEKAG